MKKLLALLLVCLMVFAVVSCDDPETPSEFAAFEEAISQSLSSKVNVSTKISTELGELNSSVETVFNPNGSATVTYSIEQFNPNFDAGDSKIVKTDVVTLNADGTYSDGGAFQGALGENIANVSLVLDAAKLASYTIEDGVLSATVKAENTEAVLGVDIDADVNFMLVISGKRVISLAMNYTVEIGAVDVLVSYN